MNQLVNGRTVIPFAAQDMLHLQSRKLQVQPFKEQDGHPLVIQIHRTKDAAKHILTVRINQYACLKPVITGESALRIFLVTACGVPG